MKYSIAVVAIATAGLTAFPAQADNYFRQRLTDNDNGLYLGIGAGAYTTDLQLRNAAGTVTMGDTNHDAGINLFAGYNFGGGGWRLGTEFSYTNSFGSIEDWSVGGTSMKGKLQNGWAISVLPAMKLTGETAGFIRLGFGKVKGIADASFTLSGSTYSTTSSETFNTTLWGVGMEHAISDRMVFRLEYQLLDVKGKTISNLEFLPRATGLAAGIRFSF